MGISQYKIQFGGLSMGEHQFEFDVKSKFFEQFSDSEITSANISVKANLIKQNSFMLVLFSFEGQQVIGYCTLWVLRDRKLSPDKSGSYADDPGFQNCMEIRNNTH